MDASLRDSVCGMKKDPQNNQRRLLHRVCASSLPKVRPLQNATVDDGVGKSHAHQKCERRLNYVVQNKPGLFDVCLVMQERARRGYSAADKRLQIGATKDLQVGLFLVDRLHGRSYTTVLRKMIRNNS